MPPSIRTQVTIVKQYASKVFHREADGPQGSVKRDESKRTRLQDRSRERHRHGIAWQQRGRAGKPRSGQNSGPAIRLPLFGLSQIAPRVGQIGRAIWARWLPARALYEQP